MFLFVHVISVALLCCLVALLIFEAAQEALGESSRPFFIIISFGGIESMSGNISCLRLQNSCPFGINAAAHG